jgi:signal transduction histidine kinase
MAGIENDIAAVRRIGIVPTILDTVCRLTGMGFSAVARVTEDRWIACDVLDQIGFGLAPGGELPLKTTICHEIRNAGSGVVISDVEADPAYCDHHTPALYGFRSYISLPIIRANGSFFGTLCAIDPLPRDLGRSEIRATFQMFAELLAFHLDAADKLAAAEDRLADEAASGNLREQFIAVIGHDLRNPLASVDAGLTMLRKAPQASRATSILDQMQGSVRRMSALIDDILDFARGRLGGGLTLDLKLTDMEPLVTQVVTELKTSHPDRHIELSSSPRSALVWCDPKRMGQLISNLVGNAITHGAESEPITVRCAVEHGTLQFRVSNGGAQIAPEAHARLFHPFARGEGSAGREGLGLGST